MASKFETRNWSILELRGVACSWSSKYSSISSINLLSAQGWGKIIQNYTTQQFIPLPCTHPSFCFNALCILPSQSCIFLKLIRFYNDHPLPSWFFHRRKMFIPLFSYILTPLLLLLELSLQTKKIRHGKRIGGELLDGEGQQVMASKIRGVFILVLKSWKF